MLSRTQVVSHEEYLTTRLQLLEKEKSLMKAKDDVRRQRQNLPMLEVSKPCASGE